MRLVILVLALLVAFCQARLRTPNLADAETVGASLAKHGYDMLLQMRTQYQKLGISNRYFYGRTLVLDGIIQTTQRDEFFYHDMMTLPGLFGTGVCVDQNSNVSVLIIGGGDGGALRTVQEHPCVKRIVMCELDATVVEMAKNFLGFNGNYTREDTTLFIGDGFAYVQRPEVLANPFDVVVVDATDPGGPSAPLFGEKFYKLMFDALKPQGVLISHLEIPFYVSRMSANLQYNCARRMRTSFPLVEIYKLSVPTYVGGDMAFVVASKGKSVAKTTTTFRSKYYNAAVHNAAFVLPPFWLQLQDKKWPILRDQNDADDETLFSSRFTSPHGPLEVDVYVQWSLGRSLRINGHIVKTQHSAFLIDEILAFVPIYGTDCCTGKGVNVLIIGDLDGHMLKTIQTVENVGRIVHVQERQDIVKAILPYLNIHGDFTAPSVQVVTHLANVTGTFDVIIITDEMETDPAAPQAGPERVSFFADLASRLNPNGVLGLFAGVPWYMTRAVNPLFTLKRDLAPSFKSAEIYRAAAASNVGSDSAYLVATKNGQSAKLQRHTRAEGLYYSKPIHESSFALPSYWDELLAGQVPSTETPAHLKTGVKYGEYIPPLDSSESD